MRENPDITRGMLQAGAAHFAKHRTGYIKTPRAYLDAFGDIRGAVAHMGVHPNTFRYRIRRLVALLHIKLDDPDDRLVLASQLRLMSFTNDDASEPSSSERAGKT